MARAGPCWSMDPSVVGAGRQSNRGGYFVRMVPGGMMQKPIEVCVQLWLAPLFRFAQFQAVSVSA